MTDIEMNAAVETDDFSDELTDEALDRARSGLKICGAGCAGCAS